MGVGAFQPKSCRECPKWGIDMSQCPKCEIRLNYDRVQSDYTQLGDYKVVDNSENLTLPENKIDDPVDNLINSICLEHKVLRSMLTDKTLHTISDKRKLRPVRERLAQELNKIEGLQQSKIAEIIGVKKGSLWTYLDPSRYARLTKTNKPAKKSDPTLKEKKSGFVKYTKKGSRSYCKTPTVSSHGVSRMFMSRSAMELTRADCFEGVFLFYDHGNKQIGIQFTNDKESKDFLKLTNKGRKSPAVAVQGFMSYFKISPFKKVVLKKSDQKENFYIAQLEK